MLGRGSMVHAGGGPPQMSWASVGGRLCFLWNDHRLIGSTEALVRCTNEVGTYQAPHTLVL
jgi:hypothetical protein